jgi:hypothetical protein
MLRRVALVLSLLAISASGAKADFGSWSTEVKDDPFSGGQIVTADFMSTLRSGVFIFCDSTKNGLRIRSVPGFEFAPGMTYAEWMRLAIDGKLFAPLIPSVGSVGANLAASEGLMLPDMEADFIKAFTNAKRQIAVKDGISDQPQILSADGSTETGKKLLACMQKQPHWSSQ